MNSSSTNQSAIGDGMLPAIDRHILDEYFEEMGDEGARFVMRLIDIFFETSPAKVSEIAAAAAGPDYYRLNRTCHNMKSSSSTVGANRLTALCADIESRTSVILKNDAQPDAEECVVFQTLVEQLQKEYHLAADELRVIRSGLSL